MWTSISWSSGAFKDAAKYLFNIERLEIKVRDVAESAVRDVVGQPNIRPFLTGARQKTEAVVQNYPARGARLQGTGGCRGYRKDGSVSHGLRTTTNPIERTFATVRHRTIRSEGCLSNKTALAMVFKPVEQARRHRLRLDGHALLPKIILGAKFKDGIEVAAKSAAAPKKRRRLTVQVVTKNRR